MVAQQNMLDLLNCWKDRSMPPGILADIYDGAVWNSFLTVEGESFRIRWDSVLMLIGLGHTSTLNIVGTLFHHKVLNCNVF